MIHRVSEIMLHNSQCYLLCFKKYLKFVQKSVLCLFVSHVTLRKVLPSSVVQLERIQFTHTMECNRSIKHFVIVWVLGCVRSLKAFAVESIIISSYTYSVWIDIEARFLFCYEQKGANIGKYPIREEAKYHQNYVALQLQHTVVLHN